MTAIENIAQSVALRTGEALLAASGTLLVGLLVAGVVGALASDTEIARLLGVGKRWGLWRCWLLGTLLPVCALGVLPVLAALQRRGVPRQHMLTFGIAAATLSPFSLIYAASLLPTGLLGLLVTGCAAFALGCGWCAVRGWQEPPELLASLPTSTPARGEGAAERLTRVARYAAHQLAGLTGLAVGVGLLGVGLKSAVLPPGSLDALLLATNLAAPSWMVPIGLLTYEPAERAPMLVAVLFDHSFSAGAAILMLCLGAGMSLGMPFLLGRLWGWRASLRTTAKTLMLALVIGYVFHLSVRHPGIEVGDAHALDHLTRAHELGSPLATWADVLRRWREAATVPGVVSLIALVGLGVAGMVLRLRGDDPSWLNAGHFTEPLGDQPIAQVPARLTWWNRPVPAAWKWPMGAGAALAVAGACLYLFFPPAKEVWADMRILRADAYSLVRESLHRPQAREAALRRVDEWRRLTGRLPVGLMLRGQTLDGDAREKVDQLRSTLGSLEAALRAGDNEQATVLLDQAMRGYEICRVACTGS